MTQGLPQDVSEAMRNAKNVFGRYILIRELGRGGMGAVYKAWQMDLKRFVAIKFLLGNEGEEEVKRFYREAQTAATLSHANIAAIYEISVQNNKHFIAMEYVEGATFERLMRGEEKRPLEKLVTYLRDAARAADYAHSKGIIHRDLKPPNLMVNKQGKAYVMDFGLARQVRQGNTLTQEGMIVGTPSYMSPEQVSGQSKKMTRTTDVYSLGAILYEMLTGRPPFKGRTPVETLTQVVTKDPKPPRRVQPSAPADLEAICMKALEKDPKQRYTSAREFADELHRWLHHEPVTAKPLTGSKLFLRWLKANRTLVAISAAGVILALGLTIYFSGRLSKSEAAKESLDQNLEEAKKRRSKAQPFYDQGKIAYDRARSLLPVPDADPDKVRGFLREAIGHLDRALKEDPQWAEAHFLRGECHALLPNFDHAAADLTKAIEQKENYLEAYRARALLYLSRYLAETGSVSAGAEQLLPRYDALRTKSVADFERVQKWAVDPADKEFVAAVMLAVRRDPENSRRAIERIDRALELDNTRPEYYFLKASALLELELNAEAEHAIEAALRLRANYPDALRAQTIVLAESGKMEEALKRIERAVAFDPVSSRNQLVRAQVLERLGRFDDARKAAEPILLKDPDNPFALCTLSRISRGQKKLEEALSFADKAMQIAPGWGEPYALKAEVHAGRGEWDEAIRMYDQALERPGNRANFFCQRGTARFQKNDLIGALADMDEAVKAAPKDALLWKNRGFIKSKLNDFKGAVEDLEKALGLDPSQKEKIEPMIESLKKKIQ